MATISKATVINIRNYGSDVREYTLKAEKIQDFDPGTFLQLSLEKPPANRWPDSRNFSLASAYNGDNTIRIVIRRIGNYTSRIFEELNIGASCYIKYSFGDFLLPFYDQKNPIICIAGGTGVAPFFSFAEHLFNIGQQDRMHLFYSAKNSVELINPEELKRLVNKQQLHIHLTRENSGDYLNHHISIEEISEQLTDLEKAHFYICGNESFTNDFKNGLAKTGAVNIYTDEW